MIEYIEGRIDSLTPTQVVIETTGIGYGINISLAAYAALEGKQRARMLIHEVIREDAWTYYGFVDEDERQLFRLLIGVSGVGANTARMILSSLTVAQLQSTILAADAKPLKAVKGIGAKTAERIIVDLKDKIKPGDDTLSLQSPIQSESYDEALAALIMLGFPKPQSAKVLKKLFESDPVMKVESAIKKALAMM